MANETEPKTLQQAIIYFSEPQNCLDYLVARRWPNGVICPTCGRDDVRFLVNQQKWQCKSVHKQRQFSAKVGTIFEDSPLGLDKWLSAVWMIVNNKNGKSSYEMARDLGVTQKSAWFMEHRIRLAMQTGSFAKKLQGQVEADETWIGGRAINMHRSALAKRVAEFSTPRTGRNQNIGKVAVMGLLERHGEVRAMVVEGTKRQHLHGNVVKHVESGSNVYTDALRSYNQLGQDYIHGVINHAEKYVDGQIHTNGIENFWSLLKRSIKGTYISVQPYHLHRYLDEQTFRFNGRRGNDSERFQRAMEQVVGKRVMYSELTGKSKEADRQAS